jgi:hypothetical protein
MQQLRANGRAAVRAWVGERADADTSRRARELKEMSASFELAGFVYHEGGGEVIAEIVAEMESRLAAAQAAARDDRGRARLAANVGAVCENMAGDRVAARRLYEQALALDPDDGVARTGLARLERAEAIDENKEIEAARLRELEEHWAQQPRSRPPERSPIEPAPQPEAQP